MTEIACLIIAVTTIAIAVKVNRIAKLLEEREKREQQKSRVLNLEKL